MSVALVALLLVTSFLIFIPPSNDGNEELIEWSPEWNVSVGDTFQFFLTMEALPNYPYGPYEEVPFSEFNGTNIVVELISLPQLPELVNSSILIYEMLKITKTEMRLANGSAAPSTLAYHMNPVFSLCFVPTGVWTEIDTLLPDIIELDEYYMGGGYFAKFIQDSFNIGYYSFMIDSGGGFGGNFTQTTGVPFMVYSFWDSFSDSTPGYYLRADLI